MPEPLTGESDDWLPSFHKLDPMLTVGRAGSMPCYSSLISKCKYTVSKFLQFLSSLVASRSTELYCFAQHLSAMPSSEHLPRSILIIGSGVFGLSTAYSLCNNPLFEKVEIILVDRAEFPAPDGASVLLPS